MRILTLCLGMKRARSYESEPPVTALISRTIGVLIDPTRPSAIHAEFERGRGKKTATRLWVGRKTKKEKR